MILLMEAERSVLMTSAATLDYRTRPSSPPQRPADATAGELVGSGAFLKFNKEV